MRRITKLATWHTNPGAVSAGTVATKPDRSPTSQRRDHQGDQRETARHEAAEIRLGEFALSGTLSTPLMLLGDATRLHVRVGIDENDAWRVQPGASAIAFVRGNPDLNTRLRLVPKVSLTGQSTERTDTRVLQAIYSFDPVALPVYVGQQMDVFIEAPVSSPSQRTSENKALIAR